MEREPLAAEVGCSQRRLDPDPRDPLEMPNVAGHHLQPVVDRGRGDLQVGVGKPPPVAIEPRLNFTENPGDGHVVGKHRDGLKDS